MEERDLSRREREVLERIVGSPDVKFREVYLAQLSVVRVTERSECCPSVSLRVPPLTVDRAPEESRSVEHPLGAEGRWTGPFGRSMEVLVFQRDGWLSYLELVHYDVDMSKADLPPAGELEIVARW